MAIISVIKYEGNNSTFVFKHPTIDFNTGTQLIVHETQEAVFLRDGRIMDRFGAGKYTLDTESLPMMKTFFKKIADGPSQFHAEIYFINLVTVMGIKWGTDSKVRMFDPASGLHLEIGAFGDFNMRVSDSGKVLLKLVGTELGLKKEDILDSNGYSTPNVSSKFKGLVMTKVKSLLPKSIRENNINILEVDEHLEEVSKYIREELNKTFDSYGFYLPEFFVTNIVTPDNDPNFKKLKEQHAERYLLIQQERIKEAEALARKGRVIVEAETEAELKIIDVKAQEETTKRLAYAEAEKTRAEGLAKADVMQAQQFTYQQETQRQIGVAVAENEGGSGGGGVGSAISGVVQAGVGIGAALAVGKATIGAVSGVMDDVMKPDDNSTKTPNPVSWKCTVCGTEGNVGKFCHECGSKNVVNNNNWTCPNCGKTDNTGNYCGNCGTKRS